MSSLAELEVDSSFLFKKLLALLEDRELDFRMDPTDPLRPRRVYVLSIKGTKILLAFEDSLSFRWMSISYTVVYAEDFLSHEIETLNAVLLPKVRSLQDREQERVRVAIKEDMERRKKALLTALEVNDDV